jgi:hypothetical protein
VYSRELPFSYPAWWIQSDSDGWIACGYAWPYFPGLKAGKTFISIFLFKLFGGVDFKS